MANQSPLCQNHSQALAHSQNVAQLTKQGTITDRIPFISNNESVERWLECEQLCLSCLRTGDDKGAFLCLERLTARFGTSNEKVMALRGLYQEAVAEDSAALEIILQEYEETLVDDPANFVYNQM